MVSARAVAAAAGVWVLLHMLLLVRSLEQTSSPVLDLTAAAVAVTATAYALAPLLGRPSVLLPGRAAVLAAVYVAVAATVTLTLSPDGFRGYANWWPGGLAPLLAALVVRRQALAALAAALGGTAVLAVGAVLTQPPGGRLGPTVALAFPLALWPLGALAFRAVLDRADTAVADLRWGAAQTRARARRDDAHDVAAAQVLEHAVPLLEDRAAGRTPTEEDQVRARQVERAVRDEIRGGRLLDAVTRDRARTLRARGWHVAVDDHGAHDIAAPADDEHEAALLADLVHTTMLTCLQAGGAGRLELTRPVDPTIRLTVLAHGPGPVLDAVVGAAHEVLTRRQRVGEATWSLDVDRDEAPTAPPTVPGAGKHPDLWLALVRRE